MDISFSSSSRQELQSHPRRWEGCSCFSAGCIWTEESLFECPSDSEGLENPLKVFPPFSNFLPLSSPIVGKGKTFPRFLFRYFRKKREIQKGEIDEDVRRIPFPSVNFFISSSQSLIRPSSLLPTRLRKIEKIILDSDSSK